MRSVAQDGGVYGITSNAVLPGWVRTEMAERSARAEAKDRGITPEQVWDERAALYPPGRVATPREVAEMIAFLASEESERRQWTGHHGCAWRYLVVLKDRPGYVMYGAEFSLYSGKLRSYLRKKGIEFTEIQPWVMTYKRFIVPRTGVRYIPVLQTPEDDVWQDTTVIIDHMEERFPQPPVYPGHGEAEARGADSGGVWR